MIFLCNYFLATSSCPIKRKKTLLTCTLPVEFPARRRDQSFFYRRDIACRKLQSSRRISLPWIADRFRESSSPPVGKMGNVQSRHCPNNAIFVPPLNRNFRRTSIGTIFLCLDSHKANSLPPALEKKRKKKNRGKRKRKKSKKKKKWK